MDAETRQARLPAVELPADPQSPVYSAPAYSADSAPPSRPPVAVTAGARARGASLSASNAPLTDSETSADRRPSHAPPYSLDPDCPPSFLDAEFDSSLPPAYAPRTAPQAAVGRAAHPSVPPEAAKTVQSQSLAQIFATMKYPVETRTGWLYHSLVLDMLFAVLVGVSTLGYSLLGTAWIQYSGTKGDPAGEAYLALWGVCVSNSTSTLKCGFTWATDAYRGYFSSAMIVAVPSLASFSWFAVMTVAFMSAGLLRE